MNWQELVEISRYYGADPDFLLAGGGNTSFKENDYLYIKASGFALADIDETGFTKLKRSALNLIWEKEYPVEIHLKEKKVLQDLLEARVEGELKRPSVESLLHAVLPHAYVVHTHPALVNGLTCGKKGEETARRLFKVRCLWVPAIYPGYTTAKMIKTALEQHIRDHQVIPEILFLENHGMFVGADTVERIKAVHNEVTAALKELITREPDFSAVPVDNSRVEQAVQHIRSYPAFRKAELVFENNREISRAITGADCFLKVHSAFTPDQIVYAGPENLFAENLDTLYDEIEDYRQLHSCAPRVIAVKNAGVFAVGTSGKAARAALLLFLDSLKIAVYTESFGGYKFMDKDQIVFIQHWEAEKFRAEISLDKPW